MSYDLKPVKAPCLSRWKLRLATALMESGIFRRFLLGDLFRKTGITAFRSWEPEAAPRSTPLVDPVQRGGPVNGAQGLPLAESLVGAAGSQVRQGGIPFASITDYAEAYREGRCSPEDVARRVIAAVENSNALTPPLRAVIKWDSDDILKQAAESAKRIAEDRARSVLEGVPVAVKDELDQCPYSTGVGTSFLANGPVREDATVVSRLREAGALLIGKANMFEIGISPTGNNPNDGFARNPHHLGHDAGGSSGGSGAAVGSGLVPLAVGADGGGSIRIPAAHCGVVGLKPTYGRVSEHGAVPLCWSVGHVGPLGATALDAAIGYAVCAGWDAADPMTERQPLPHLRDFQNLDLAGVTIGIYPDWFEDADPEIVEACRETLGILQAAGATVKEVVIAGLEQIRVAHAVTILSEMAAAMDPYYQEHRKDFAHATRLNLALAREMTSVDYVRAQRIRGDAMTEWARVFGEVDVVVTPTTGCLSPALDPRTERYGESDMGLLTELMRFVVSANLCGHPAISFPAGYTEAGIPIGMQVIGRHWEEHLLLRLANVAESQGEQRRPAVHYELLAGERDSS